MESAGAAVLPENKSDVAAIAQGEVFENAATAPDKQSVTAAPVPERVSSSAGPAEGEKLVSAVIAPEEISQHAALAPGTEVEVTGTSMAGSVGVAEEYLEARERWKVRFASGISKNFKVEMLRVLPPSKHRSKKHKRLTEVELTKMEDGVQRLPATGPRPEVQVASPVSEVVQLMMQQEQTASQRIEQRDSASQDAATSMAASRVTAPREQSEAVSPSSARIQEEADLEPVNLAGRSFASRAALVEHVRAMQARAEGNTYHEGRLEGEDKFLMFHIVMQHPKTFEKLRAPVRAFRYGVHSQFPKSKCFIIVFANGTEEPVSVMRCVKELFAQGSIALKRKRRAGDEEEGACSSVVAVGSDAEERLRARKEQRSATQGEQILQGLDLSTETSVRWRV